MLKNFNTVPGQYAGLLYVNCQVVEAGLKALNGDASDKTKLVAAMRAVNLTDTPRGPVRTADDGPDRHRAREDQKRDARWPDGAADVQARPGQGREQRLPVLRTAHSPGVDRTAGEQGPMRLTVGRP